jgi:hypothetical protein
MRFVVDTAELETLCRIYEQQTTELAGITLDLRRRLHEDLLDRLAGYGLPTRAVAYEAERAGHELTARVRELEQFTLDLQRVWAEASGLAREGRLIGSRGVAPGMWWFRGVGNGGSSAPDSFAFAAATDPAPAGPAAVVAPEVGAAVIPEAAPGTWQELDRYLVSQGVRINTPPEAWQTTDGSHSPTSYHYVSRARDYSELMNCDERAIVAAFRPFCGSGIEELYHANTGTWFRSNVGYHTDHVHAAISAGFRFPT